MGFVGQPRNRLCQIYISDQILIWVHNCFGYYLIETACLDQGQSLGSLPDLTEVTGDQGGSLSSLPGSPGGPWISAAHASGRGRIRGRVTAAGAKR